MTEADQLCRRDGGQDRGRDRLRGEHAADEFVPRLPAAVGLLVVDDAVEVLMHEALGLFERQHTGSRAGGPLLARCHWRQRNTRECPSAGRDGECQAEPGDSDFPVGHGGDGADPSLPCRRARASLSRS